MAGEADAISKAERARYDIEERLKDLIDARIVEIVISGVSGWGKNPDWNSNVGVHLSVGMPDAARHMHDISSRCTAINEGGVYVTVYPKQP